MIQFNNWLATRLGNILGSIYFFYLCIILDLIELPPVIKTHDVITWTTYISQTVIQLIALPILQIYQNLQQQRHDELSAKISLMHKHVREVHKHLGVKDA